jgi:hypothetical protein
MNGKSVRHLGIYEIYNNALPIHLDSQGDLNIQVLIPLLFKYVNEEYVKTIFVSSMDTPSYSLTKEDNWVVQYMKNPNYSITDVGGGGDCFFYVIQSGLKEVGLNVTIKYLRSILSAHADQVYDLYKTLYVDYSKEKEELSGQLKQLLNDNTIIMKKISDTTISEEDKVVLQAERTKIKYKYTIVNNNYKQVNDNINDYIGMKDIDTIDKFKTYLESKSYWADVWAISLIESVINVKMIILSQVQFNHNNLSNVLQCGDNRMSEEISPIFYIITNYTGDHYKLIQYNNKGIFRFHELPSDLTTLIIDTCMSSKNGVYNNIPDFKQLLV